jgi:hypothetical protein
MRTRKSIWYGVLGLNLGLLVGCTGEGVVLDGEETGGKGNSGGTSSGGSDPGSGGESEDDPHGTGATTGHGTGGIDGAGAAPGNGGDVGAGATPGNGGDVGAGAAPGGGGAGGFVGYGGAGGDLGGAGGDYGGAGGLDGSGAAPPGAGAAPGGTFIPDDCDLVMIPPPVKVSSGFDSSACFGFSIDPDPAMQIAAIRPVIVNPRAMHHMVLYQAPADQLPQGVCPSDEAKGAPIYVFAPGVSDLELPADVGLGLGTGRFIVELHYVNLTNQPFVQSGGFCAALTDGRTNTAGIVRLGSGSRSVPPGTNSVSYGICAPRLTSTVHVLSTTLDLGRFGQSAWASIDNVSGGNRRAMFDHRLGGEKLVTLSTPAELAVGETIDSACRHSNETATAVDGRCNLWMLAYPISQFGDGAVPVCTADGSPEGRP